MYYVVHSYRTYYIMYNRILTKISTLNNEQLLVLYASTKVLSYVVMNTKVLSKVRCTFVLSYMTAGKKGKINEYFKVHVRVLYSTLLQF